MTPEQLKILFELAKPGGKWHELTQHRKTVKCSCGTEWSPGNLNSYDKDFEIHKKMNPTFTTPQELFDVMDGLVREGLWKAFYLYTEQKYRKAINIMPYKHNLWLFGKDEHAKLRFFKLVVECPAVLTWYQNAKENRDG